MCETLGKGLLSAGIDETSMVKPSDGEDSAHLTRGTADEESAAFVRQQLVGENDCRDPSGVDEVAALETDKNLNIVDDGGIEPPLKLVGDREIQLALHSHFAASGVEVYLADPKRAQLRRWRGRARTSTATVETLMY